MEIYSLRPLVESAGTVNSVYRKSTATYKRFIQMIIGSRRSEAERSRASVRRTRRRLSAGREWIA